MKMMWYAAPEQATELGIDKNIIDTNSTIDSARQSDSPIDYWSISVEPSAAWDL